MDRGSSQQPRLSQGASAVRKAVRELPAFSNDANFGRASGKIMKLGSIEKDGDGFEPLGPYLDPDNWRSPPPNITPKAPVKPKPKPPPRKPPVLSAVVEDDDDDGDLHDDIDQYFSQPAAPSTSRRPAQPARPVASKPNSSINFNSIPAPAPRRKTPLPPPAATKQTATQSNRIPSAKPTAANRKDKPRELTAIPEDDAMEEDEPENDDSNMSLASVVNPTTTYNQDDDDSGPEDFGGGGDMDIDQEDEPEPEPITRKTNASTSRTIREPSEEAAAEDDDQRQQFDYPDQNQDMEPPEEEEQQEDEEEPESPKSRRARLAREKKENLKAKQKEKAQEKARERANRPPLKAKDQNAKVVKRVWNQDQEDDDDDDGPGVRRGKRKRYAPLEYWRGERAILRRPRRGEAPVPIIEAVITIPQDEPEPFAHKKKRRGGTKPPSSRGSAKGRPAETWVENPEDGLDEDTEEMGIVVDYDTKEDAEQVIAQTAAMLEPKRPMNADYAFQKVFMDGDFVAGGILEIPVGGAKPSKPARDNTYIFYCIEGAVRVMVHKSNFVISRNGMFMVPRGNQYYLENISDRDCKLFFAQARKVTENMIPSPMKRASAMPSSSGRYLSHTPGGASSSPTKASPVKRKK